MWKYIEKAAVMCIAAAVGAAMTFGATPTKSANADGTLIWSIPAAQSLLDPMQACGWLTKKQGVKFNAPVSQLLVGKYIEQIRCLHSIVMCSSHSSRGLEYNCVPLLIEGINLIYAVLDRLRGLVVPIGKRADCSVNIKNICHLACSSILVVE